MVGRLVLLYAHVEPVHQPRPRRASEEEGRRLVEVGQRRARHSGEYRRACVPRRERGHCAHDREAGQPVRHRHVHELRAAVPVSPVRRRVEREVRQHAEGEGQRWAATRSGTDHGTGKHVNGNQHVL
jgi:5-methylcytosine-specific restriction endonuclease McrA